MEKTEYNSKHHLLYLKEETQYKFMVPHHTVETISKLGASLFQILIPLCLLSENVT